MSKLIECVPNFSEGRDPEIIQQITDAIASADGVSLLDVDPGETTNRTVVTFVGPTKATIEAAFRGNTKARILAWERLTFAHLFRSTTPIGTKRSPAPRNWENASGRN